MTWLGAAMATGLYHLTEKQENPPSYADSPMSDANNQQVPEMIPKF